MNPTLRLAAFAVCLLSASARADLDLDSNGLGDVWEAKYRPAVLAPADDPDQDGRSNHEECEAGTDPFKGDDVFSVQSITVNGSNLLLGWPSQAGKRYQLQFTETPGNQASWQSIPGLHAGTGTTNEATVPKPASSKSFFRVVTADVDTDNDGLTDWEELQAGFNPNADEQHDCHCGDNCGCGPNCGCDATDLERMTRGLQKPPKVTVEAIDTESAEPLGGTATETGTFTVKRRGGIGRVVVNVQRTGTASASDLQPLPTTVVLPLGAAQADVPVLPVADAIVESTETVQLSVQPGTTYQVEASDPAVVLVQDSVQPNGTGLLASFWKHPNTTANAPYFTGPPTLTRIDATVNYDNAIAAWPGSPITVTTTSGTTSNYFSSRWEGEVLPEFSQAYTFYASGNEICRLWVNGQLLQLGTSATPPVPLDNDWEHPPVAPTTNEGSAIVSLQAGKRYPIVLEHYNNTGGHRAVLSWSSVSQLKQVIPQARLFPNAPPRILGPLETWAFIGSPGFSYQIQASASPTSYAAANLPAGFSLSPSGLITGTPTEAGTWKVTLTATNAHGSGSAFLTLNVLETSGAITRELWTGVPGNTVASIPVSQTPASTTPLASLTTPADSGDDYGARIRGFVTAPVSGDYRFTLSADEAAVFSLSDDEEPVNSWKRAELTTPGVVESPILRLEGGQRYFLEILHKESSGPDNLSLSWTRPDTGATEVIPGYLLTRFEDVSLGSSPDGTLYFTPLTPQNGAVTNAYGSCTLRLSPDKTTAWVKPDFGNLGSAFFAMHVHDDRLPSTSNIVFDLDEPGVEILMDGSYVWHITGVGSLSAQEIADGISQHAFLNVHSVNYPAGEIKGYFRPLNGSATFTPPPAPPAWTSEPAAAHTNANAAARFLQQTTFGASPADITALQGKASYEAWIDDQFTKPSTYHLPYVEQFRNVTAPQSPTYGGTLTFNSWWKNSIQGEDQLRQRIAFALSEIMVVSENGPLDDRANALSSYYDMLLDHSFGNARDLLEAVTLHPAMGRYLDMLRNEKPDLTRGRIPNENYAREILQLFSLGLYRFHPDGSLILNSHGVPIPVYDQEAIIGLAHVFTGWNYHYTGDYLTSLSGSSNWTEPMREVPARHFTGKKRVLNNVVLPGLPMLNGVPLDPYGSHSTSTISGKPEFQALARQELDAVHDQIFNHPNFGPFLCRQLIQRLVTSTPSRGYIYRVVSKFNDNGSGVRGDLQAVIKAILLDYEARSLVAASAPGYGKQREPLLRVTQLGRAFRPSVNSFTGTFSQDGGVININTAPFLHRLTGSQGVQLGFSSGGVPATDGTYSLSTSFPSTTTSFNVRTKDIYRCNWSQAASTITVVTPSTHSFDAGESVYLRFRTGTPDTPENGVYQVVTDVSDNTFTVTAATAATRSGTCDTAWLTGAYSTNDTAVLTVTFGTQSGLVAGQKINLTFTPITGQTTTPTAGTYIVAMVDSVEPRRVTLTPDTGVAVPPTGRSGTFHAAPHSPVLDRTGTVISGYSDWNISSTDTDLGQTPLRAPTVFNFFEPDYQFPGALSANGLITPEFQISSDTNVIRQANFLFGGIYSSSTSTTGGYTNGFNSFRAGAHDIMMDFSPWMGARPSATGNWTDTANLRALIQELSKVLMAGQMSTGMENAIYNFVSNTGNLSYNATTPTDSERRNRVRSIIYFIAVSPEHAIQR